MSAEPRPDRELGVLETVLVLAGQPVQLGHHLARLDSSLEVLFPGRMPPSGVLETIEGVAREIDLGGLRVTVAPAGISGMDVSVQVAEIEPDRILPAEVPTIAAGSVIVPGGLGRHKWADRTFLAGAQSQIGADAVPLIFDRDGTLLEASRANAFAVIDGALLTPPADGRILPGVARGCALEIADASGIEIRETRLCREDLAAADEVFLTGSLRGVERVGSLDGSRLGTKGDVSAQISAGLRSAWTGSRLDRVPRR